MTPRSSLASVTNPPCPRLLPGDLPGDQTLEELSNGKPWRVWSEREEPGEEDGVAENMREETVGVALFMPNECAAASRVEIQTR